MPTYDLSTAGRQYKRQFDSAIRGNLIRALTELITNSDDSYSKLEESETTISGDITIVYDRGERHISVIDNAEGLNSNAMKEKFVDYGAAVSGFKEGRSVRGYFGKGIKDVLFSMSKGKVRSIVGGKLYVSKFVWSRKKPKINISDRTLRVTEEMRGSLGITKNGTIVDFLLTDDIRTSLHETVAKNLKNFYMLRRINSNPKRSVLLKTLNANGTVYEEPINYTNPIGDVILSENFPVKIDGFPPFQIYLEISKSKDALTQEGDDREGGLLIVDENDAVLDLTLFDYDKNIYADNLFGLIRIQNFRELLIEEERVLSDTRDGLDMHHPFNKSLQEQVQKRLKPIIDEERRKQQRENNNISRKNRERLNNSIDKINDLLKELTSQDWSVGTRTGETEQEIHGIKFPLAEINIIEGIVANVRLKINTKDVPPGTNVTIASSNRSITVSPNNIVVINDDNTDIVDHFVTIKGTKAGEEGEVTAKALTFQSCMNVNVIQDQYPIPQNGFSFIPDVIRVSNNDKRYGYLFISRNIGSVGDIVSFKSNSPNIQVLNQEARIKEQYFKNDICMIRISITGSGIGQQGEIEATLNNRSTSLSVEIISKRTRRKPGRSGLISRYDFSEKPNTRKRSYYEDDTGIIWIYKKHPTISRYFSDIEMNLALSLPHCQLLLSEVILEEVAWIARNKMRESNKVLYLSDDHTQEDITAINLFKYQYGAAIHSWIIDDDTLQNAINTFQLG